MNKKILKVISLLLVITLGFSSCARIKNFFSKKKEEKSSLPEVVNETPPEVEVENNTMPDDVKDILEIDGSDKPIERIIEFDDVNSDDASSSTESSGSSSESSKADSKVNNTKSAVSSSSKADSSASTAKTATSSSSLKSESQSSSQSGSSETTSISEDDLNKKLSTLSNDIFALINKERTDAGISALIANDTLIKAAGIRSKEAMDNPDLGHTRPDTTGAHTVLNDVDYTKSGVIMGENLVFTAYDATAEKLVELWRNSPEHYKNYMDPDFIYTGISINYNSSSDFTLACAQIFAN